ncbi:MAG: hypothetical protein Q8R47_00490 [Nanoarchaeota archaeon]|nr:hypothetical protein [Nanoarchaeota archaeon]
MKHQSVSMESLIRKHHLRSRGYAYVGDSAVPKSSPDFDKNLLKRLQEAEKTEEVAIGDKISFYAIFPEEEEKIPDTLPGGFQAPAKKNPSEKSGSPYRTIKRKLPSELLYELGSERLGISYDRIHKTYFEPNQNAGHNHKYKHILTIDDLVIMSRMEDKNTLDSAKLQGNQSGEEDRKAGRRLENHLRLSPLITRVSRGQVYTLSSEALDGMYAAVVHKRYLPPDWQ